MTDKEYQQLQDALTRKLKNHKGYSSNKETAYNDGILVAKSIIKSFYEHQKGGDLNA